MGIALLANPLRISTRVDEKSPALDPPAQSTANKPAKRFVNIFARKPFDVPTIPSHIKKVIVGFQGFYCTPGGVEGFKEKINDDEVLVIDSGKYWNLGFTNDLTRRLPELVDAVVQKFGNPVSTIGQSGGSFQSILVLQANPDLIDKMFFTSGPLDLTLDPEDLKNHTNIGPLVSPMTWKIFRKLYNQGMMNGWSDYKHGIDSEVALRIKEALDSKPKVAFAASEDTYVRNTKCGLVEGPSSRFLAFKGPHDAAGEMAGPAIRYLVTQDDIHVPLPDEVTQFLVPVTELIPLPQVRASKIAFDFVTLSHRKHLKEAVANVPVHAKSLISGIRLPGPDLARSQDLTPRSRVA